MFKDRFLEALERKRKSLRWLAKETGLSVSALQYYARGTRSPGFDNMEKIAQALDVSLDWLAGRDFRERQQAEAMLSTLIHEANLRWGDMELGTKGRAKVPIVGYIPGEAECDFSGGVPMAEPLGVTEWFADDPDLWAAIVKGDDLAPILRNGWTIFCSPGIKWENGDMVIVKLKSGAMIAGYIDVHSGQHSIAPFNPTRSTVHLEADEIELIHRIVGVRTLPTGGKGNGKAAKRRVQAR